MQWSGLVASDAVVWSENGISLGVASSQPESNTNPHWEGSSLEEQDGCQNTAAEAQAGLDQRVG